MIMSTQDRLDRVAELEGKRDTVGLSETEASEHDRLYRYLWSLLVHNN